MTAKLISLSLNGSLIEEELPFDALIINESRAPKIIALAIENPIHFFTKYQETLIKGDVPLILNPGIPEAKLIEIAKLLKAACLVTKENEFKFDEESAGVSKTHILCSSGTTSKGVIGKQFVFNIDDAIKNGAAHLESLGINTPSKILLPLPVTHSFGLVAGILGSLTSNHELYVMPSHASASNILDAVRNFEIDHLYLTPSLLKMMIKLLKRKKTEFRSPHSISIGSSLLLISELEELMGYFPDTNFYFTYGLTEMGPRTFTFNAGSAISPNPNLKSLRGGPVPIGEVISGVSYKIENDELYILSPYQAINIDHGFYATQDRADMTPAGVRVHGRMDFTIIKGGINIYPAEIEGLLTDFSDVKDCALVGIKSESYGQVPVLIVQVEMIREDLIVEITEFLKINLPASHLPSRIVLRTNEFPRTSMGKIKTQVLIDELGHV